MITFFYDYDHLLLQKPNGNTSCVLPSICLKLIQRLYDNSNISIMSKHSNI